MTELNKSRELPVTEIVCRFCESCDPWILIECYSCEKKWWQRVVLAKRWCEPCFEKEIGVARLLVTTGHEIPNSSRFFDNYNNWAFTVTKIAKTILFHDLECSKTNLVPAIWPVLDRDWDKVKKKCQKRFAWKRK